MVGQPTRSAYGPGTVGENLTVDGVDLTAAVVGERWRVGAAVLRVTEPRIPCFKLGIRLAGRRWSSKRRSPHGRLFSQND